ncbi:MAG: DUF359 domain-containing protein [Thaumarchaeota archaeon]|nr:DUF359 domain-containing protein [Nitrososphaerota archaeon]
MPEQLRRLLKTPIGRLIPSDKVSTKTLKEHVKDCRLIVAVGDRTTETLFTMGIVPDVHVIDGVEKRTPRSLPASTYVAEIKIHNPAGYISEEAIGAVAESLKTVKPLRIFVDGEEDLLALLFAAIYPVETAILYGQPGEGVVVVVLDKEAKELAANLLKKIGVEHP